jgi:hypothetical protein
MFITSIDYKNKLEKVIVESSSLSVAVAFWGLGAEEIFRRADKPVRLLCNLTSGGTNPEAIERLMVPNIVIHHHERLHAKVVLGEKEAIVGSANISTNGLNDEGGDIPKGWEEAGMTTSEPADLKRIRGWFDELWQESEAQLVTPTSDLLIRAKENWEWSRCNRPLKFSIGQSVLELGVEQLRDRGIFVLGYTGLLSEAAINAAKEYNLARNEDIFENWTDLQKGQKIICVKIEDSGVVTKDGLWEINSDRIPFKCGISKGRQNSFFHRALKIEKLKFRGESLKFTDSDWSVILAKFKELIKRGDIDLRGSDGMLRPLVDFLNSP